MKYAWISRHRKHYNLDSMCQVLDVSRSGYLASCNRPMSPRERTNRKLIIDIKAAHHRGRGIYGAAKIKADLADQGIDVSVNRIKRLRQSHGIFCVHKRKFKVTTQSDHRHPVAPNLLNQQFDSTTAPNQVWLADITYIETDEGRLYLAAVKDLHSCELIGWAMDSRMTKTLVIDALRMAYQRKRPPSGLIHHSDRGSQYCSYDYQNVLRSYGIKSSMSRKGNCWDNASMESFFAALKVECVYQQKYKTREQARRSIFDYIEVFYNQIRRHQSLNHISPANYARQYDQQAMRMVA